MNMIEKVARSMAAKREELIAQPLSRVWRDLAKAAIEVMKIPTKEMVREGNSATTDGRGAFDAYQAMIDTALKEND